jgi:hypothetical protein
VTPPVLRRALAAVVAGSVIAATLSCSSSSAQPRISSIAPNRISARGGSELTLRGADFAADTTVELGGEPVRALKVVSPSECTFTTPPLFAGQADVVASSGSRSAKLPAGVDVLRMDLRFVEAPPYAIPSVGEQDGGAEGGASDGGASDGGDLGTATGVAIADFGRTGTPDLVTCVAGAACRYLANDGSGNFSEAADRFPSDAADTRAIVAADFDGDGDLDLFVGTGAGAPGVLYENLGNGFFSNVGPGTLPADTDAVSAVASGDIDGDGLPDLVVGNATGAGAPLRVYLSSGGRHGAIRFDSSPAGAVPTADWALSAIALGDVDGDGRIDVLIATTSAKDGIALRYLRNEGGELHEVDAGFPTQLPGTIRALAAGDVSGDGAIDLVVSGDGQDRLFLNDGMGHFFDATVASMPLDDSPGTSIALVDLDRDRHPDLLIGNYGAQTRLYLNDGTGHFSDYTPLLPIISDPTVWVGIADVNGDAAADLVLVNDGDVPASLFLSVEPLPDGAP